LLISYIIITSSGFYHFVIQVRKGDTIGEFLRAIQQQLAPEFREIRTTSVENLLYVKEDLIIPHVWRPNLFIVFSKSMYIIVCVRACAHFYLIVYVIYLFLCILQQHSFYELIVNKARGKSGPVCFFSSYFWNLLCLFYFWSCVSKIFWKTIRSRVSYSSW
jgi:hypothetical protein